MAKRDYFAEIEALRSRLKKRSSRWAQATSRLDDLIDITHHIETARRRDLPFRNELAKYISIGFVACAEGFFRLAIRDLVDAGAPFQGNVVKLKDVRITIDHVVEIHKRRATLGEFVAHGVSMSSLEEINDIMSTLMAIDFLDELKKVPINLVDSPKSLIELGVADRLVRDVKFSFEHRHLFAHELAPKFKVDVKAISMASRGIFIFLHAADNLVQREIDGAAA